MKNLLKRRIIVPIVIGGVSLFNHKYERRFINFKTSLSTVFCSSKESSSNKKLVMSQVFYRHGDRLPLAEIRQLEEVTL